MKKSDMVCRLCLNQVIRKGDWLWCACRPNPYFKHGNDIRVRVWR